MTEKDQYYAWCVTISCLEGKYSLSVRLIQTNFYNIFPLALVAKMPVLIRATQYIEIRS